MKVSMQLNNLNDNDLTIDSCKGRICRNLSRIMDIKVVEVNVKERMISFIYENPKALNLVTDELRRIGYPVKKIIKITKAKLYNRIVNKQTGQIKQ